MFPSFMMHAAIEAIKQLGNQQLSLNDKMKYKSKQITVDAVRWDGIKLESVPEWISQSLERAPGQPNSAFRYRDDVHVWGVTGELSVATPGDYIIRSDDGNITSCDGILFQDMFYPDDGRNSDFDPKVGCFRIGTGEPPDKYKHFIPAQHWEGLIGFKRPIHLHLHGDWSILISVDNMRKLLVNLNCNPVPPVVTVSL